MTQIGTHSIHRKPPQPTLSAGSADSADALAPAALAPRRPEPLDPSLQTKLLAIRADRPPRAITRDRHYLVSNENQHHLFQPLVAGKGGVQVGVGAEQNYLLAGWALPEILILVDYDQWVVDLNWVYGLLFERATTPEQFIECWTFAKRRQTVSWIRERWPEPKNQWRKVRVFQSGQAEVHYRLERLRQRHQRNGIACFLDEQRQYDYLADLWRTGRVTSVRGDLLQGQTLQDIAQVSHDAALPVRLLYLSNTEEYFTYDSGHFRENMLALPYDEQSVVLHTRPYDRDYYRYVYQSGLNFQAWLRSELVRHFCDLFAYSAPAGHGEADQDLFQVAALPEQAARVRKVACTPPQKVYP